MASCSKQAVALIVTLAGGVVAAQDPPPSLEQQAKRQGGRAATPCGIVVACQCQRPERTTLLALEKPRSGSGSASHRPERPQ